MPFGGDARAAAGPEACAEPCAVTCGLAAATTGCGFRFWRPAAVVLCCPEAGAELFAGVPPLDGGLVAL